MQVKFIISRFLKSFFSKVWFYTKIILKNYVFIYFCSNQISAVVILCFLSTITTAFEYQLDVTCTNTETNQTCDCNILSLPSNSTKTDVDFQNLPVLVSTESSKQNGMDMTFPFATTSTLSGLTEVNVEPENKNNSCTKVS